MVKSKDEKRLLTCWFLKKKLVFTAEDSDAS